MLAWEEKSKDFRRRLKVERQRLLSVRLIGTEMRLVGPACENARAPYVASQRRGRSMWPRSAEQ